MPFQSLAQPRQRLADQVYDQIMAAIHRGEITTEDRIVQEKLAEQFQISRTPVREALFRMEQEGILVVAGRGGFRIRTLDRQEIGELYGARCAIEGYSVRLLAERRDAALNDALRQAVTEAEQLQDRTVAAYFRANKTVHRGFVEATGNRFLLELFDNLWNLGSAFTLFATIEAVDLSKSLGDHLSLVEAIASGNGSRAAERMIAHINAGRELQIEAGRQRGTIA